MRKFLPILLFLVMGLSACTSGRDQVREIVLGPADTPATQVYRMAAGLWLIGERLQLESGEILTARVRLANSRAYDAVKEAYAAVSLSNDPPELPRLVSEGSRAVQLLAALAKGTDIVQNFPGLNPLSFGGWVVGTVLDAEPVYSLYKIRLEEINENLTLFFLENRDPTQKKWDELWKNLEISQSKIRSR